MSPEARRDDVMQQGSCVRCRTLICIAISCGCGMIQDVKIEGGRVSFAIVLTTPACPVRDSLRDECDRVVKALPWVESVAVDMQATTRTGSRHGQRAVGAPCQERHRHCQRQG